jgi:hypothetical protein
VRFISKWSAVVLAVVAGAGCGANPKGTTLSARDLRSIASVRPATPGWAWPRRSTHEKPSASCDGWRWQDEEKLGVTFACLADSKTEAHKGLMGARAFARRWAKRTVDGGHFTDLPLQGLGEEAWRIQEDFAGGQEVTYGWRRSRLLLQIHIQCIFETCPSDILRAGRVWADAIDKEAVDAVNGNVRTSPSSRARLSAPASPDPPECPRVDSLGASRYLMSDTRGNEGKSTVAYEITSSMRKPRVARSWSA